MHRVDKLLRWLFILGLCILAFLAGPLTLHYKLPPSKYFSDAFSAADAWWKTLRPPEQVPLELNEKNQDQINEGIITYPTIEVWNKAKAENGYTLVSTGFMDSAWLVNMEGNIVYRWDMPFKKAWPSASHIHQRANAVTFFDCAYVLPNGDLIVQYSALGDTPYGYGILKLDKDSNVLWTYSGNAHHDFYVDKGNGDIYALTHEMVKNSGVKGLPAPILNDFIVVLSTDGKEKQRISLLDAFLDTPFELMLYHDRNSGLAKWDHFHSNSITKLEPEIANAFPSFEAGFLLVSIRSMNAVAVINPETGKVVWAYDGGWKAQHAAHFLSNGNIMIFDNRGHYENKKIYSRVIAFDPVSLAVKWHYAGNAERNFYSSIVGRLQPLPGGNILIAESMKGRIFEITPEGEIVWSYKLQSARRRDGTLNAIFTSIRYPESALPFLKKDVN